MLLLLVCSLFSFAQTGVNKVDPKLRQQQQKHRQDSLAKASKAKLKAMAIARQAKADSIKTVREARMDSIKNVREAKADSLAKIRKYKESKHFRDSVAAIKKYKQDSIALSRAERLDSMKTARNSKLEQLKETRKKTLDSIKQEREERLTQLTEKRKKIADSITQKREDIKDSIAKAKEKKEKELLAKKKSLQEKLTIKIKTDEQKQFEAAQKKHLEKQAKWNNQVLLKRQWSLHRRIYQNTVSRYNYLYNAQRKYDAAIASLQKSYKENYDSLISIEHYSLEEAATKVSSEMDSVIRKCSFSTQIHDPRSKWMDDLFLLMAKAYYNKNDFENAISTLQFIISEYKEVNLKKMGSPAPKNNYTTSKKDTARVIANICSKENRKGLHKLSHHIVRNDAYLWLLKTYVAANMWGDAEVLANALQSDKNFPARLKGQLYKYKAMLDLHNESPKDAIVSLEKALKEKLSKQDKLRINFMLAQLNAQQEKYQLAIQHYKQAIKYHPNVEMDLTARLAIASNLSKNSEAKSKEAFNLVNVLINDSKYKPYQDRIYITMSEIVGISDIEKSKKYLASAIKAASKESNVKGLAFIKLGEIYFNAGDYINAAVNYDSASILLANKNYPNYEGIKTRSNNLKNLATELLIIKAQDSLMALAQKSKKEQIANAKSTLKKLREASAIDTNAAPAAVPLTASNIVNTWYFFNTALLEKGKGEFMTKWGNRPLVDNWRRKEAVGKANNAEELAQENGSEKEVESKDDDIDKLLAAIPMTEEQKKICEVKKMNAVYNSGILFFGAFNDYPRSIAMMDTILAKYNYENFRMRALYSMYLNYSKLQQMQKANEYLSLLKKEFPTSDYVKLAEDPNYALTLSNEQKNINAHYEQTYAYYESQKYDSAFHQIKYAREKFLFNETTPKYDVLEAMINIKLKNYNTAKDELNEVVKKFSEQEEGKYAGDILKYLNVLIAKANGDSLAAVTNATKGQAANYIFDDKAVHYYLFYFKQTDGRLSKMKDEMTNFIDLKYQSAGLKSELSLFDENSGVLLVKEFKQGTMASIFFKDLNQNGDKVLQFFDPSEYEHFVISKQNYNLMIASRDVEAYLAFFKKNYK